MTITEDQMKDWIKALRSGDYKQTKMTLKEYFRNGTYGYCCLGVLESVCGREPEAQFYDEENEMIEEGPEGTYARIGISLQEYAIDTDTLMDMNDKGKPFTEIADYIEGNILWKS